MPTPLEIEIGIHYHCTAEMDYREGEFGAPAIRDALDLFLELGLLKHSDGKRSYEPTDGLGAWMSALCQVPFPEQQWVIPRRTAGIAGVGASLGSTIGAGALIKMDNEALRQQVAAERWNARD